MESHNADMGMKDRSFFKDPRAILVTVVVLVVVVVTAILVYRNNQQSQATHAEFEAEQKEFGASEAAYKESLQKLTTAVDTCEKMYESYDLCSALEQARKDSAARYFAVKEDASAIDSTIEESLGEAIINLHSATVTIRELTSDASDAVVMYEKSLLKAVQDEHSMLLNEARTNLKEAKALLSTSEGKTSDEELWKAFSRVLDVYEKELDNNTDVKSDDVDEYIASSEALRVEKAAIASATKHLDSIYKGSSSNS